MNTNNIRRKIALIIIALAICLSAAGCGDGKLGEELGRKFWDAATEQYGGGDTDLVDAFSGN